MATNKRIRKPAKATKEVLEVPSLDPMHMLRQREKLLQKRMHRMKVTMTADRLGFPTEKQRLTYAQASAKRRRVLVHAAEFIITAILFVGACSWLYQFWLSRQ